MKYVLKRLTLYLSAVFILTILWIIPYKKILAATNQCNGSGVLIGPIYLNTNAQNPDYYSLGSFKFAVRVEQVTPTSGITPGYFFVSNTESCGDGCIKAAAFCMSTINSQGQNLADSINRVKIELPTETLSDGSYYRGLLRIGSIDPGGTLDLKEPTSYIKTVQTNLDQPAESIGELHYTWTPPANLISTPVLSVSSTTISVNDPTDEIITINLGSRLSNRYDFVIGSTTGQFKGTGQIVCLTPQNKSAPQCQLPSGRTPPDWFKGVFINTSSDSASGQTVTTALLAIKNANSLPQGTYRPELTPVGLPQISTSFEVTSQTSIVSDIKPVLVPSTLDTKATPNARVEIHLEKGTSDFYYAYPEPALTWQIQLTPPEYSSSRDKITLSNNVGIKNSATFQLTSQGLLPNAVNSQGYKIEVKDSTGSLRGVTYLKVTGTRDSPPPSGGLGGSSGSDSTLKCKDGSNSCTSAAGTSCNTDNGHIALPDKYRKDALGNDILTYIDEKTEADVDPKHRGVLTAIGCVPTDPVELIKGLLKFSAGIGGGIALLLMVFGAFQMMTSMGNPDALKKAHDQFINAGIGLLFIIFSIMLLQIIGVDILSLPGFL